jgi:hypothetical protein
VTAYDTARSELVLFSGPAGTFTFNGGNWTLHNPLHSPSIERSSLASLAYDAATQQVVLFGGTGSSQPHADLNQTWTWDGNDWSQKT